MTTLVANSAKIRIVYPVQLIISCTQQLSCLYKNVLLICLYKCWECIFAYHWYLPHRLPIVGCIMAPWLYSLVGMLDEQIVFIIQHYFESLECVKGVSCVFCRMCSLLEFVFIFEPNLLIVDIVSVLNLIIIVKSEVLLGLLRNVRFNSQPYCAPVWINLYTCVYSSVMVMVRWHLI